MKTPRTQIKIIALALSGLSLAPGHSAGAQADGGPTYKASGHAGVVERDVPAPQAEAQARAVTVAPRRNTGMRLRNRRTVRLRNGRTVQAFDVDPTSLPHETATLTRDGKLVLQCLDPAHKHLSQSAHGSKHRITKSTAKSNARPVAKKAVKSMAKGPKRATR